MPAYFLLGDRLYTASTAFATTIAPMKSFAYAALVVGAGATSLKSCSDLGWHSFATTGKLICAASYCDGKFFDESQGFRQQAYTSDRMTLADNKDYCSWHPRSHVHL